MQPPCIANIARASQSLLANLSGLWSDLNCLLFRIPKSLTSSQHKSEVMKNMQSLICIKLDLVLLWSLLNFTRFWTYMALHLLQSGIHKCASMLIKFFSTPNSCHAVSRKWGEVYLLEFEGPKFFDWKVGFKITAGCWRQPVSRRIWIPVRRFGPLPNFPFKHHLYQIW